MADPGHEETEEIIRQIERRINKEYKQAEKEVSAKLDDYFRRFEKKDERWQEWVADGVKTKAEYKKWRTGQIAIGERWTEMRDDLAKDLANTSKIARSIAQEYMPEVYATNFNYGTYDVEHQAKVSTSFTLYSRESVERLMRDDPEVLPGPGKKVLSEIAMGKAVRWEKTELQSAMLQGLLQGESIPSLATRVANTVGDSDRKAAIRNARTMATGVQNSGRIDSYNRAKKMGIELEKQWLATLDSRTRHTHRMLDGQTVPVNDPFVTEYGEIMYPGDPAGDPADVYNCRCTLISQVKGFETNVTDMSLRQDDKLGDMSYEEWKAQKKSESNPITLPEEKAENIRQAYLAEYRKGGKSVDKSMSDDKINNMTRKEENPVAIVNNSKLTDYYGNIKREVYLSDERRGHIFDHHPNDYGKYKDYIPLVISEPDLILDDHKNPMTAMFIKKIDEDGVNVIVKLALQESKNDRSFVVTMHSLGSSGIKRIIKKNVTIYSKTE